MDNDCDANGICICLNEYTGDKCNQCSDSYECNFECTNGCDTSCDPTAQCILKVGLTPPPPPPFDADVLYIGKVKL